MSSHRRLTWSFVVLAALALAIVLGLRRWMARPSCGGPAPAILRVSGLVTDGEGRALPGVTLRFEGTARAAATTASNGRYAIEALVAAVDIDWTIAPSRPGCRFAPPSARVVRPELHAQAGFVGLDPSCVGTVRVAARDAPSDPGPRPGEPGAGGPTLRDKSPAALEAARAACIPGLAAPMMHLCQQAFLRFQEVDSVSGSVPAEEGAGLGPAFNGNGCGMCHQQPAILGSAVGPFSPQRPAPNPQLALARLDGARNVVPPFVVADGPTLVARFKSDGEVHDLYTIAGRVDARGCALLQPDFTGNLARGNLAFRIPLALYGLGLVEAVAEATLEANLASSQSESLGIHGGFNRSINEGTINRFGWKAQTKSLLAFAGEAYNVEIGVTNELFPQERNGVPGCVFNGTPEDDTDPTRQGSVSDTNSDVQNFALAIRLSAPPRPGNPFGVEAESVERGRARFEEIGCAHCHTPTLTTSISNLDPSLSKTTLHPFSDFALHRMGAALADGIVQGSAGPDQFRTTPLWGVGQRLFFLHDGRTSNLVDAIEAHTSPGSEANAVIANFDGLPQSDRQDVVNFLRSL